MKLAKKILISLLVFVLFLTTHGGAIIYAAEYAAAPKTTVLSNDYIKITVDNGTGRFGIRTVEGQPVRKGDNNVNMLFRGDDPETSFTTFRIDGTDYIFGNPYKFGAGFFSETTQPVIVTNPNGTRQIETVWSIKGVHIKQILMLYTNPNDRVNAGNVNVRYEVLNASGAQVELGTRILLDTMVAGNDGPEFQIGTAYRAPLSVERRFVHDPVAIGIPEADEAYYKLPPYWVMRDKLDLTNPAHTNAIAYGFNNFSENHTNILDEMIVGHWNGLANTKWDYTVNTNLDFTRDTNDYGTADSAVALYWQPRPLAHATMQSFETVYGLGDIIAPDKVFSIRFLDPVMQLATLEDGSGYADEGIFDINVEIENLASFNMEHTNMTIELTLESGLEFVSVDAQGQIIRNDEGVVQTDNVRTKQRVERKPASIEDVENGIIPKYQPGDTTTVSFKVMAKGRPWPATKQYLISVRSPETVEKLTSSPSGNRKWQTEEEQPAVEETEEGEEEDTLKTDEDDGVAAAYDVSKANFILLPPIGEATATYVYGLSPKEAYVTDEKYITLNLSNVEAYATGNEHSEPNFDLYLKETVTGKRYKVPVTDSVLIQATDNGATGDMIITYRGGDLVDHNGDVIQGGLGPELPLGEYQVEIDFKGDAGGDEEVAALFDIVTPQTFLVTDNDDTRIRNSNLLVVYKQTVDLTSVPLSADEDFLESINEVMYHKPFAPGGGLADAKLDLVPSLAVMAMASRVIDPDHKVEDLFVNSFPDGGMLEEYPLYNYRTFNSEEEIEAFFDDREDREALVTIEGMIRQIGSGDNLQAIVDTTTEPAIINGAVHYQGKDIVFVRGGLEVFGAQYHGIPLLDTLFARGDGTLSVAGSGFVFHRGEWTLDFYNGFQKSIPRSEEDDDDEEEEEEEGDDDNNPEDDTLNGSIKWAQGAIGSRLNPMRQVMIEDVYFNRHSLFSLLPLSIGGFTFSFNEFILREGGISFGGSISFKVVDAEIKDVIFNSKGFVGVDASLKFELNQDMGLIKKDSNTEGVKGQIDVTHYEQKVPGINNYYALAFEAELANMMSVNVELALKKVDDGRVLPDVIAFGSSLPSPGVLITGATYLTAIRGAIRELADTIAGGTKQDPFPLTLEAGVSLRFGVAPAYHFGDIDLTLKRTGLKIVGKLDFSTDPTGNNLINMITEALLEAQWVTPWFVRLQAEIDVMGWDVIIGKGSIFVGQNLEKNRIDFEGFVGARVQVPGGVPIIGGMPLASVFFGLNNDKVWGSVGILFISVGITYYWGGGIEFGTSGDDLPEGLMHLIVEDPERGSQLVVIGQGIETVATSWFTSEAESHEIIYRDLGDGTALIDQGTMSIGIGGITTSNGGRVHNIPMAMVEGNALLEVDYEGPELPELSLRDGSGRAYPLVIDNSNTNPQANAFTQWIPAAQAIDGVDAYKLYIAVPESQVHAGNGPWRLASESPVVTKLLSVPTLPELESVNLTANASDSNKFTASWSVSNAKAGDTINLYLTKDAVSELQPAATSDEVLEPGEPGLLIAKELPVGTDGNGSYSIDVTAVSLLGDVEDIRGLLQQGEYYLRAELKSYASFDTMTSAQKFEIIDPFAPVRASDVRVEPAGNGMFALSFKPAEKKAGHEQFEHSFVIHAETMQAGKLDVYDSFGELLFTEEELAPYWNVASGKYEGIMIGGWTEVSTGTGNGDGPAGTIKFTGLQAGASYSIAVTSATKPTADVDKNENYRFAEATGSPLTLLPIPVEPKLRLASDSGFRPMMELLTKETAQTVSIVANQQNIEVEALYNGQSLGITKLTNTAGGSAGTITLDEFTIDGTYAIELMARNTATKDQRITVLYLTVDTLAPVLYISEPLTGERTSDGYIRVAGQTSNDAVLTVRGVHVEVAEDGSFDATIPARSEEPTIDLEFVARDGAGNDNFAVVSVTNGSFEVPVGLVLRSMTVAPGEERKIEAGLRYADGTTDDGRQLFKTVAVQGSELAKLDYHMITGEGLTLESDGTVLGLQTGAALIEVNYRVSDNVTLQSFMPIQVEEVQPTTLQHISAHTSLISGASNLTRAVVTNAGELLGYQLVYRTFPASGPAARPAFGEDLSNWTHLPEGGAVFANPGDRIIVAKRTSSDKKAVASSNVLPAIVWSQGPGGMFGGGGFGGIGGIGEPAEPLSLTLNGTSVDAEWIGDMLAAVIATEHIANLEGDLRIGAGAGSAAGYMIRVERGAVQQTVASDKSIVIDLPGVKLTITPDQLRNLQGDLDIAIAPASVEAAQQAQAIADSAQAELLGRGAGVSIAMNIPAVDWGVQTKSKIAIPANVSLRDLTAIVQMDENGNWTPVPWQLEMIGGKAYANISLTAFGSLYFMSGSAEFSDIPSGFWGKAGIDQAASKLLVMGKGQGKFDPNGRVTRAEFPTMLLRAAGLMTQTSTASFPDVPADSWYGRSVAIASRFGLVTGLGDGSYAPHNTLSRLEGMTMIGRMLDMYETEQPLTDEDISEILARYSDSHMIPAWGRKPAALAVKHGIITGDASGRIDPGGELNRAQAAVIATRVQTWLAERE